ncbi:MAG: cysteine hydrolase [Alicyclobacillaceae bacterium]|nr:cysteine hydrolase [Alicyclobacillaceae bacterium]
MKPWTHPQIDWRVRPERSALLVIDMQNDFVREGAPMEIPMARQFLPNMVRIVDACRRLEVPVIFTQHVLFDHIPVSPLEVSIQPHLQRSGIREGEPGVEIVEELQPRPGELVVRKHRYDAFYNTQLDTWVRNIRGIQQIDTLIITGTVTSICCESTARSAYMRDYKVMFVSDANGGFDEASQAATLRTIGQAFGRVLDTATLLAELAGEPSHTTD